MDQFSLIKKSRLTVVVVPVLSSQDGLVHGFSTRDGGISKAHCTSLNLSLKVGDYLENVMENRDRFAQALDHEHEQWAGVDQVHGNQVVVIKEAKPSYGKADALVTNQRGVFLTISAADCVPILLFDPVRQAAGAVHAGWKGTLARVVQKTLESMKERFGTDYSDVMAGIGPAIGPCCYQVGAEVTAAFKKDFVYAEELFSGSVEPDHLDLALANARQLQEFGVKEENVSRVGLCTSCKTDLFFSHRRDHGKTGRMVSLIGMI